MSKRHCCINNCTNGGYKINQWKKTFCFKHNINHGIGSCICDPPFTLFTFPSEKSDSYNRGVWIKNINRKATDNKIWLPNVDSRVCSEHFLDGRPTVLNPYPTLKLGHSGKIITESRPPPLDRTNITPVKKPRANKSSIETPSHSESDACTLICEPDVIADVGAFNSKQNFDTVENVHLCDHDYFTECVSCINKDKEIKALKMEIQKLKGELNVAICKTKVGQLDIVFKNDKSVKFYTGIPTVNAFNILFKLIEPKVRNIRYWSGPKRFSLHILKHKKVQKQGAKRGLTPKEEMVLTLMKLRLGLQHEDLGDRFGISKSYVSRIFTTWLKVLSDFFGQLVYNPSKEEVVDNLPPSFKHPPYSSVRHIIDCSEVFLETPSNLDIAAKTWSDYKHHHTGKFLVSIIPSGMINFVSSCWGGRTSDKHITNNSGFLNLIEPFDTVLADRGFQIQEELTLLQAHLLVPPGRRGACQMSTAEVQKTKQIANRRIYGTGNQTNENF